MTKMTIIDSAVETMKALHYAGNDLEAIGAEALALLFFLPSDDEMKSEVHHHANICVNNNCSYYEGEVEDGRDATLQEDAGALYDEIRGE